MRRKGRRKRGQGEERRGRLPAAHSIEERPKGADGRMRLGDREADAVIGKRGGACLVALVDGKSRFPIGGKSKRQASKQVSEVMMRPLEGQPCESITPDRGKEFAGYQLVAKKTGVQFHFAQPSCPWQRGANGNTNGLLREYFPHLNHLPPTHL
ncbi:IS30 family transposase [Xiamenia xianingshaonis]|uniref:IS30 family transposase n=1 Tax=Xiamenia xianingshaonis TaxID=2682776 RepID=A0A9E6MSI2_9ACTN|nr:IS30 family transposase [Xiamenia xianingshaonis]QTU85099.1 IS30 family transposase [Xiamenia xianingshaonis]